MLRDEYLIMQRQDLVTLQDENLNALCDVFEEVLNKLPKSTDIDSKKSVEDCYNEMKKFAQKNAKNGFFAFSSIAVFDFVTEYLDVKSLIDLNVQKSFVDLSDFL